MEKETDLQNIKGEQPKLKKQPAVDINSVERFSPAKKEGLNSEQVALRIEQGLSNGVNKKKSKSVLNIICSNLFTFFNVFYFVIAAVLIVFEQLDQCFFMLVIVANIVIAIVQQIRSKIVLDRLNLITIPSISVVRDSVATEIPTSDVVLDDIVTYSMGQQICADSIVLDGTLEANESMLTGESDSVPKKKGDTLFAGSYVVSGKCVAKIDKIRKYSYIESLTARAQVYQKPRSELLKSLKAILLFVGILLVPMLFFLWDTNASSYGFNWTQDVSSSNVAFIDTLTKTAGSIISMIPVGPVLLTSVALAVSVIRLAKHKTMVQELYCIEMLARVDCLCLDKTGTLTDGSMKVLDCIDLRTSIEAYTLREIMNSFLRAQDDNNMTSVALKNYFGCPKQTVLKSTAIIPFSSQRKLSAVSFSAQGTYILGAPEFVLKSKNTRVDEFVKRYTKEGMRVLLLAHSDNAIFKNELPTVRQAVALIVIEDHIREEAEETVQWFIKNGVEIKIISGDNPQTVSAIAIRVGVDNAEKYISLEGMTDDEVAQCASEYAVFGRVSPDQKAVLIKALKKNGKTVAMTGDGVNDILAMKESDCSVALASGADAARNVSHLVLLDNNFATMPKVVAEGRRVVNNIQNSTSMYYMKTIYIVFINLMLLVLNYGFKTAMSSPYTSNQILLLESVVVGFSTMVLALQPNENIIKGKFIPNLIRRCLPYSITFILATVVSYALKSLDVVEMTNDEMSTVISIAYTFGGLWALNVACKPYDRFWKYILYFGVLLATITGIVVLYWLGNNAYMGSVYTNLNIEQLLLLLVLILSSAIVMDFLVRLFKPKDKKVRIKE